jgi:hypothetical protein
MKSLCNYFRKQIKDEDLDIKVSENTRTYRIVARGSSFVRVCESIERQATELFNSLGLTIRDRPQVYYNGKCRFYAKVSRGKRYSEIDKEIEYKKEGVDFLGHPAIQNMCLYL